VTGVMTVVGTHPEDSTERVAVGRAATTRGRRTDAGGGDDGMNGDR
jgi:hypothetical protein